MTNSERTIVILAGGVAKGAFEAGALEALAATGMRIDSVMAASSGALNGAYLAASIRAGIQREAAPRLSQLWRDSADWLHSLHFNFKDFVSGLGLSDSKRVQQILREHIDPMAVAQVNPIALQLVVGVVGGRLGEVDGQPATTYEAVLNFDERSFATAEDRERIYRAVSASAAFPLLFAPVAVEQLGPCYDGGGVNNTPLRLAIDDGATRIVVIAPYPVLAEYKPNQSGRELLMGLLEVIVHERLYRDWREAEKINRVVRGFKELAARGALGDEQLQAVLGVTGWREVQILNIRPAKELPGDVFAGLLDRSLREQYIDSGKAAAEEAIGAATNMI